MKHEDPIYYCDKQRHLVCTPYSIANLHKMADKLKLNRSWFHVNHYDIPLRRRSEIEGKCTLTNTRGIINIINTRGVECPACFHLQIAEVKDNHLQLTRFSKKVYSEKRIRLVVKGIQCEGCGYLIELPEEKKPHPKRRGKRTERVQS